MCTTRRLWFLQESHRRTIGFLNHEKTEDTGMARTKTLVVVLAFATTIAGTGSGQGRFTIEQVLSAPFPAELTASTSGKRVAWLFNDQGRRNVWAAEAPQFKARPLTRFDADDGQPLTELTWR